MIQHRIETEDLMLSITKNFATLFEQTHKKPRETLEPKPTKPMETFSFKPSNNLCLHCKSMTGLTSFEVYNSILV